MSLRDMDFRNISKVEGWRQAGILARFLFRSGIQSALLVPKSCGLGKPSTCRHLSDAILLLQIAKTAWAAPQGIHRE